MNKNVIIGIIAVLVVAGVAAYFLVGGSDQPQPAQTPVAANPSRPAPPPETSAPAAPRTGGSGTGGGAQMVTNEEAAQEEATESVPAAVRKAQPRARPTRSRAEAPTRPDTEEEVDVRLPKAKKPPASALQGD